MLDLYLLRHAESALNEQPGVIGGRSNQVLLSERGKKQAAALGSRLVEEGVKFDVVYASPAVRTRETAQIVCGIVGHPLEKIIFTEKLYELSQGDWEGKPRSEIYTPEILHKINTMNGTFQPPNGESQMMVENRVYSIVHELLKREKTTIAGFVGHGMAFKCLLRGIMDFPASLTYKVVLDNASITQLKHSNLGWHPVRINDAAHTHQIGKVRDHYVPK